LISLREYAVLLHTKVVPVYTVLIGSHDRISHFPSTIPGLAGFLFTDQDLPSTYRGWHVVRLELPTLHSPTIISRTVKYSSNQLFPYSPYSLYIDSSFQFGPGFVDLIPRAVSSEITLFVHPSRQCVSQEIQACLNTSKLSPHSAQQVNKLLATYLSYSDNTLYATGMLAFSHSSLRLTMMSEEMLFLVNTVCTRDQVVLPYLLRKYSIDVSTIKESIYNNQYACPLPHTTEGPLRLARWILGSCTSLTRISNRLIPFLRNYASSLNAIANVSRK